MAFQTVFKRYELKYLLTPEQKTIIINEMTPFMKPDKYGRSTIRNLYFDADDYLLIRRSIEKPEYKEKLRVRCYGKATEDSTVFVELKKKYKHVVYKRRISLTESEAVDWLTKGEGLSLHSQISDEVDYFICHYHALKAKAYISYEREAYYSKDDSDFRVTFDDNVLFRTDDLSLRSEPYGDALLPDGMVLMELKCSGGIPAWMTDILSRERIYKTSFSKYGTGYEKIIFPKLKNVGVHKTKETFCNA